ncbi:MAG: phosphoenolpyruvate mutase [Thiotrichales bacterium]|nr:phosphoenolpyruvate mutase [Thiotrichales bacterium]
MEAKTRTLRNLLESDVTEFIMEAHNGISARIVEQAGFRGIWASGLAISAQFGVRDSNEASWTQVVDTLEFMSDITSVPILLDGDTGYGNFNNMRRLVKKLEQRNIAGVCIEDKQFPKLNSFIDGERQPLADIGEFCGKIKAGKDSQNDADFCIIARIEALIAGWGMAEAIKRAEAYHAAGADGILIHSKLSKPDEILVFADEWAGRSPLIIVPTTYYSTPVEVYEKAGISLVIWANHMIRAAVAAMIKTSEEIRKDRSVSNIEDRIATVKDIFSLQGTEELTEAQKRYASASGTATNAIVLAASRGTALQDLTEDKPKIMIPIGGKSLLRRLVDVFKRQDIHSTTVVAGYKADSINVSGVNKSINERYESSGELASLMCARDHFHEDMIITYGDLLFRDYILQDLLTADGDLVITVDSVLAADYISGSPDYAWCSQPDDRSLFRQHITLDHMGKERTEGDAQPSGRWIGMLRVRNKGLQWISDALDELQKQDDFDQLNIPDLLNFLVADGKTIKVHYINGHWLDINVLQDLDKASDFTS